MSEPFWQVEKADAPSEEAEPIAWAKYVESRLLHFERCAHPRSDPVPVVAMMATRDH